MKMNKRFKNMGFSLVEVIIVAGLFSVIVLAMHTSFIMMAKSRYVGTIRMDIYNEATLSMEKIVRNTRKGISAAVSGGNTLTITNSNGTYSYAYSSVNKTITYDPDDSVSGNEKIILTDVLSVSGLDVFSKNDNLINIIFGVEKANNTGIKQRFVLESSACLRNN
jgi:Tfp pilus assembly protein FimT